MSNPFIKLTGNFTTKNALSAESQLIAFAADALTAFTDAQNVGYDREHTPWVGEDEAVATIIKAALPLLENERGQLVPTASIASYIYERYVRSVTRGQLTPTGRDYVVNVALAILNAITHRVTADEAYTEDGKWNELWYDLLDFVEPVLVVNPDNGLKVLRADLADWV
jgi:hypothetical protein